MIEELECGCAIEADFAGYGANSDMSNYQNWRVVYCRKHAAADEMYTVLTSTDKALKKRNFECLDNNLYEIHKAIKAIIVVATGDSDG